MLRNLDKYQNAKDIDGVSGLIDGEGDREGEALYGLPSLSQDELARKPVLRPQLRPNDQELSGRP
jgi:hypothetical protein